MQEKTRVRRVALYIRVSSLEQATFGHSLKMQKDELEAWCKENNCIIHDYYIDDGYTATSLKRPELQRMLSESADFDMIIFVKLDRFSRGVGNYYKIMERLNATKTDWKAIFEEYDTTTANGRFMINIYLSMAEQEAALASERTKSVFLSRVKNGECPIGNMPKGYRKIRVDGIQRMAIDEDFAPYVKDAFKHFSQYASMSAALQYANNKYGVSICKKSFKRMLTNKIYIGIYEHNEIGEVPNFCPPIITEKEFYTVQDLLTKNLKKSASTKKKYSYIFAGMLRCRQCDRRLGGATQERKPKSGAYLRKVYRCSKSRTDHACDNNYPMSEKHIEEYLLENVRDLLEQKIITYNIEKEKNTNSQIDKFKASAKKIQTKMSKLKDLYLDDIIQREDYELKYRALEVDLSQLNEVIEKSEIAEKHFDIKLYESFLDQNFEEIYHTLHRDDRRRLWLSVVDKIIVGKHYIEPIFF